MSPTIAKSLSDGAEIVVTNDAGAGMVGRPIADLETPALLVDLHAIEDNIRAMRAVLHGTGVGLRPHFKNHRSLALAHWQVEAGAIGLCVARLRHAEVLARSGIRSILLTNEIVTEPEFARAARLAAHCDLIIAVDSREAVRGLAAAAERAGTQIHVAVDVDLGMGRTGVKRGDALALAGLVQQTGLLLRGLTAYEGHLQRMPPGIEKEIQCHAAAAELAWLADNLRQRGRAIDLVSAGGTGTCSIVARCEAITEIQAGCYLLMETLYEESAPQFRPALKVLATVISRRGDRAVVDTGVKALSSERGMGHVLDYAGVLVTALHAEHGMLDRTGHAEMPKLASRVGLSVPYADGTVNLHTRMFGIRNGLVEAVFQIER